MKEYSGLDDLELFTIEYHSDGTSASFTATHITDGVYYIDNSVTRETQISGGPRHA